MGGDCVLGLDGRDVHGPADDQVFVAPGDGHITVGIDAGEVAGAEVPVVDEVLRVQLGLAVVAVEHAGPAHHQLALSVGMQAPLGVEYAQLEPGQAHPHGLFDLALRRVGDAGGETAFGHAPQGCDVGVRQLRRTATDQGRRHLGATAQEAPHGCQFGLAATPFGVDEIEQERGGGRREVGAVAGHQIEGRVGVPFVLEDERGAQQQRQAGAVNRADAVAQRGGHEHGRTVVEPEALGELQVERGQRVFAVADGLGRAGRARGEHEVSSGVGHVDCACGRDRRAVHNELGFADHCHRELGGDPDDSAPNRLVGSRLAVRAGADDHGRLDQVTDVAQVSLGGGDRGRGRNVARSQHGQEHDHPVRAVRQVDQHHPPAGADSRADLIGGLPGRAPHLGPGQGTAAADQR